MTDLFPFRTFVGLTLLGILIICVSGYILFQARFLIIGPQITMTTDPFPVQNERFVALEGSAFNISRLWLNDRQIFTDIQGDFSEALFLENGYTVATLRAQDRYGRETTIERTFVYLPASYYQVNE